MNNSEEIKRIVEQLRPIDDTLSQKLFEDVDFTQNVLRIILSMPTLKVKKATTQKEITFLSDERSLILDVYAEDDKGVLYNIELQKAISGASPKRAAYHSSALNVFTLKKGQKFTDLPNKYVIFICEHDVFNKEQPMYVIERRNITTGEKFEDGEKIIYLNCAYDNVDTDLGKLLHDFLKSSSKNMLLPFMQQRTYISKEKSEGGSTMCKLVEDFAKKQSAKDNAKLAKDNAELAKENAEKDKRIAFLEEQLKAAKQ